MALASRGEFYAITINLREDIERQALACGSGAKRFLANRIAYHVDAVLGRLVDLWFVLELSAPPRPRLHLHCEFGCTEAEVKQLRKALRAAGGKWEPPRDDTRCIAIPIPTAVT